VSATVAIIPARGGSKGIPRKNLIDVCGQPLVAWSILHARHAKGVDAVYVSSDSDEILSVSQRYGALPIVRPAEISGDRASSESAWLHALDTIEASGVAVARILGLQATSPIRAPADLEQALAQHERDRLDSLFAATEVADFFTWRIDETTTGATASRGSSSTSATWRTARSTSSRRRCCAPATAWASARAST
jgi:CMP-N,N'-diacetyllegionaminic acid synthase